MRVAMPPHTTLTSITYSGFLRHQPKQQDVLFTSAQTSVIWVKIHDSSLIIFLNLSDHLFGSVCIILLYPLIVYCFFLVLSIPVSLTVRFSWIISLVRLITLGAVHGTVDWSRQRMPIERHATVCLSVSLSLSLSSLWSIRSK